MKNLILSLLLAVTVTLSEQEAIAIHTMLLESKNPNRTLGEMAGVMSVLSKRIQEGQQRAEEERPETQPWEKKRK